MNKTAKGALAASAAAVLLMGGTGTLAYWTAQDNIDGGSINAGTLTLTSAGDCEGWEYTAGAASAGDPVELFVPGDLVTNICTFVVGATGDNLVAEVQAEDAVFTPDGATSLSLLPVTSYKIAGGAGGVAERVIADGGTITSDDDGATITATINVEIPYGNETTTNANNMQGIEAALSDISILLTQDNPN